MKVSKTVISVLGLFLVVQTTLAAPKPQETQTALGGLASFFTDSGSLISDIFTGGAESIADLVREFTDIGDGILEFTAELTGAFADTLVGLTSATGAVISGVFELTIAVIGAPVEIITNAFASGFNIIGALVNVGGDIVDFIVDFGFALILVPLDLLERLSLVFGDVLEVFLSAVESFTRNATEFVFNLISIPVEILGAAAESGFAIIGGLINGTGALIGAVVETTAGLIAAPIQIVAGVLALTTQLLDNVVTTGINFGLDLIQSPFQLLGNLLNGDDEDTELFANTDFSQLFSNLDFDLLDDDVLDNIIDPLLELVTDELDIGNFIDRILEPWLGNEEEGTDALLVRILDGIADPIFTQILEGTGLFNDFFDALDISGFLDLDTLINPFLDPFFNLLDDTFDDEGTLDQIIGATVDSVDGLIDPIFGLFDNIGDIVSGDDDDEDDDGILGAIFDIPFSLPDLSGIFGDDDDDDDDDDDN